MAMQRTRHAVGRFDKLEDRTAPAIFTVSSPNDAGPGSLRDAIAQANATPSADTIDFAPQLQRQTITLASTDPDGEVGPTALVVTNGPLTIRGTGQTIARSTNAAAFRL